jgi:hypothetical protein
MKHRVPLPPIIARKRRDRADKFPLRGESVA